MDDTIPVSLVKLRSERARWQLFRAGGVIGAVARLLDNSEVEIDDNAREEMYQALKLAEETLDATAETLDGKTFTEAQTQLETIKLSREPEAQP